MGRTKAEHKKHLTRLFRGEAERHGLTYVRQLEFRWPYEDDTAIGLDILLQTHARSPHVWAVPNTYAWRKDLATLEKKLGLPQSGATFTENLGYSMPDRQSWNEWVFLNEDPAPGARLIDRPDYDTTVTYGTEQDVMNHLFDGFFEGAIPSLRKYTRLEVAAEMLEAKPQGFFELRPMIYFLLGDYAAADKAMSAVLDKHHHETAYGAYYRAFAKSLYAEMGTAPPRVSSEPAPAPKPLEIRESCFCVFSDQFAAERAQVESLQKGTIALLSTIIMAGVALLNAYLTNTNSTAGIGGA